MIIPIDIWNKTVIKYEEVKDLNEPEKKASDYKGTLTKEEGERFEEYVKESRNEWDRDIDFSPLNDYKSKG